MRRALLVAPGLAVVAALAAVFLPLSVVSQSGPGPLQTLELEYAQRSLLQTEGASVLLAAGLPVRVALMPLVFGAGRHGRRAEIASAVLLGVFVVVAGFSIGLFYLPAALAAIVVARRSPGPQPRLTASAARTRPGRSKGPAGPERGTERSAVPQRPLTAPLRPSMTME